MSFDRPKAVASLRAGFDRSFRRALVRYPQLSRRAFGHAAARATCLRRHRLSGATPRHDRASFEPSKAVAFLRAGLDHFFRRLFGRYPQLSRRVLGHAAARAAGPRPLLGWIDAARRGRCRAWRRRSRRRCAPSSTAIGGGPCAVRARAGGPAPPTGHSSFHSDWRRVPGGARSSARTAPGAARR